MLLLNQCFPTNVVAFTTDRSVDFTLNEKSLSDEQRDLLYKYVGDDVDHLVSIRQVHEDNVLVVKDANSEIKDADAVLTDRYNLPITVRTADCLPIFVCDSKRNLIGLVHAGWRGTHKKVLSRTIHIMVDEWSSRVEDLSFAFGPAIRECCYEVGESFKEYFKKDVIERDNKLYLDLPGLNRKMLEKMGIQEDQIYDCQKCTSCESRYFSYRRQKEKAGRMISVMMLGEKK